MERLLTDSIHEGYSLKKASLQTVQINLGNRCNQSCKHCHIGGSPRGQRNMDKDTASKIIDKLIHTDIANVEFTGGTPELNPNLRVFIEKLTRAGKSLTVRTSLTILDEPQFSDFIELYRRYGVRIVASLSGPFPDVTDKQRGHGVFRRSISVLQRLNAIGYGSDELILDLVYNPPGPELPPAQEALEREFKEILREDYGIRFNRLYCITNMPIGRFKKVLQRQGLFEEYMKTLKEAFNPDTLQGLMCLDQITIDYQGYVFDCDFNLALGLKTRGYEYTEFWEIDFEAFTPEVVLYEHCYGCTAGRGSSCHGEVAEHRQKVRNYYGRTLKRTSDLKTSACCPPEAAPEYIRKVLPYIVDEVKERFYGCGSPVPPAIEGCRVLDLGCGTGRDVFIASKLVGPEGYVIGVDMTEDQLAVARRNLKLQMERFGYKKPNVEFHPGYIEDLRGIGIDDNSMDVVISNCVINLSADKRAVFSEVFRVLKPGGEFYFSDVFADRRLPEHLKDDPVLVGECLAGAMYIEDFRRLLLELGIRDFRVVSRRKISIDNPEIEQKIGMANFYSITIRAFKLYNLEDRCEDYGQIAIYKGNIAEFPHYFELDNHHRFITGKPMPVCGNTASMLQESRFGKHFEVIGDRSVHYGLFPCSSPSTEDGSMKEGPCC